MSMVNLPNQYFIVTAISGLILFGYQLFGPTLLLNQSQDVNLHRILTSMAFVAFDLLGTLLILCPIIRLEAALMKRLLSKQSTGDNKMKSMPVVLRFLITQQLLPLAVATDFLAGTPFQRCLYRILGMKVGKDTYVDNSVGLSELQYIELGERVMVNRGAAMIGHSVLPDSSVQVSTLKIDNGACLGISSYIIGGTSMPDGSVLGALSRPFEGQILQPGYEYNNTPCKRREK